MKKNKILFLFILCLLLTSTIVDYNTIHEIAPLEHLEGDWNKK